MSTSIYPVPNAVVPATTTVPGIVQLAGDLSGTSISPSVAKLQGTTVSTTAPTANQVLTYNSGTTSWTPTTASASSMTLISSSVLSSAASTFTFSSIPQTYNQLQLYVVAKSSATGISGDYFRVRFNGDSGANYGYAGFYTNSSLYVSGNQGQTYFQADNTDLASSITTGGNAGTGAVGIAGYYNMIIPYYANTIWKKNGSVFSGSQVPGSYNCASHLQITYASTSAITSITIFPATGPNFTISSAFYLYGIN